jgi:hypothetical protein
MKPATGRLVVFAGLFAAWIGWLAYLVVTTRHPDVLRRPQFLASTLDLVADVQAAPAAVVKQVYFGGGQGVVEGQTLTVGNLTACEGWNGPGEYVLALENDGANYKVAAVPRSPGYPSERDADQVGPAVVYPVTAETLRQLEEITNEKASGGR